MSGYSLDYNVLPRVYSTYMQRDFDAVAILSTYLASRLRIIKDINDPGHLYIRNDFLTAIVRHCSSTTFETADYVNLKKNLVVQLLIIRKLSRENRITLMEKNIDGLVHKLEVEIPREVAKRSKWLHDAMSPKIKPTHNRLKSRLNLVEHS